MNEVLKKIRLINILIILLIFGMFLVLRKQISGIIPVLFLITVLGFYLLWFLRDYIDLGSPMVHEILIVIFMLGICWFIGKMIGIEKYWIIAIIGGSIYLALLFKKPEYILLLSIILITNMFSLVDSDFLRVKGMFKLRDLLLLIPFIPLIVKESMRRENIKFIFGNVSSYAILGFCGIILLFIVSTCLRYSSPFVLSFRIGRDYFFYSFFFATVYCIQRKKQLDFVLKAMIALSILFSVMYIVQAISGGALCLFPTYPLSSGRIWGVPLVRSYVSFGFAGVICSAFIGLVGIIESKRTRIWIIIGLSLLLGATFFTFGRSYWIKIIVIVFLVFLFLSRKKKKNFIKWTLAGLLIFGSLMVLIGSLRYGSHKLLVKGGIERLSSVFSEVAYCSGTYGYRRNALSLFYEHVIKKNLWFGMGFLYPETEVTKTVPFQNIVFGHSSLVTILSTMGVVGLLLHILLYSLFIIRGFFIFSHVRNSVYKGFILGFIAWYISDWVIILARGVMILYPYLTIKAMCVGLTESMYKIDKENVGDVVEM